MAQLHIPAEIAARANAHFGRYVYARLRRSPLRLLGQLMEARAEIRRLQRRCSILSREAKSRTSD